MPRRLARIRGDLDDLLADPALADTEDCWVQAVVTDPVRPTQAMERLRTRFPHTLVLSFEPVGGSPATAPVSRPVTGRTDHEVALDFVADVRGTPATEAEAALLLERLRLLPRGRRGRPGGRGALMRLHHLEITAFGPFAGTESVDFDALTDAGLFLLPARRVRARPACSTRSASRLYGEVPGDRNSAKRLRSDHAGPGVAPAVTLEVSVNGRRVPAPPLPRLEPAEAPRHRVHHRAGAGAARGVGRTAAGCTSPAGSTRPAIWSPTCWA